MQIVDLDLDDVVVVSRTSMILYDVRLLSSLSVRVNESSSLQNRISGIAG